MRRKHQRRVLINLLVIAVLALFLWAHDRYPLPTLEMEFHRAERQRLAEESVVILRCESGGELGDPTMLVGVTDSAVHTSSNSHLLNIWPKVTDSPTLVVLPSELEYHHQRISNLTIGLAAVEPPSWAETARLTLTLACGSKEADYMMEAQRQGSAFLFRLESHFPNVTSQSDQRLVSQAKAEDDAFFDLFHWTTTDRPMPPYTLEFFDSGGALIGTYDNPAAGPAVSTS